MQSIQMLMIASFRHTFQTNTTQALFHQVIWQDSYDANMLDVVQFDEESIGGL